MKRFVATLAMVFGLAVSAGAVAQNFDFRPPTTVADPTTSAVMRDLAERVLPVYQENEPERYLGNLSLLQLVAGDYVAADETRQTLRERRRAADAGRPYGRGIVLDMYAGAKAVEARDKVSFAQAFAQAYKAIVPKLSDLDAYQLTAQLAATPTVPQDSVQRLFDLRRAKASVSLNEAVDLVATYQAFEAQRAVTPVLTTLNAEDELRRYATEEKVRIDIGHGVILAAMIVRPKTTAQALPALFEFAIDPAVNYARECAAHGYVGVIAYARGVAGSSGHVLPFQHDGDDARGVIAWIIKQPWSDGRVGLFGSGYSGFAAWAAAKHLPPAVKAIAVSDAAAPGVDLPMTSGIFRNSAYRWAFNVTGAGGKNAPAGDAAWQGLDQAWYTSGKRYRDFAGPGGKRVQVFTRWLNHPSYDLFWQSMVPFGQQFAKITIPVLTTTGYFAAGEPGALYYFQQHVQHDAAADHTLLIGPYDDTAIRRGPGAAVGALPIDAVAQVNLREVRYEWFDSVFKAAKRPALLSDRINYQMAGTNEWRHAASLDALTQEPLKYYLDPTATKDRHRLATRPPAVAAVLTQSLSFKDRADVAMAPAAELLSKTLNVRHGLVYVSDALSKPVELGGLLSGKLDLTVNKMDVDLGLAVYELQANGEYVRLTDPDIEFRASYARDRVHRHLLQAGVRQQVAFHSEKMFGRKLQAGSRIVLVLSVLKQPDREINYGKGDDVSDESIADAAVPLRIRWYGSSYIELPARR